MGHVRAFEVRDIAAVIELNSRLFPGSASLTPEDQHRRFHDICFHHPWPDSGIHSLVYEDDRGGIAGFLGVIPREMMFHGETLRVAIGQHLMVDHTTLASLQLFRAFLDGPQDLSMADMAVDITRRLWERLGGQVAQLYSIYWLFPLRPISFAMTILSGHGRSEHSRGYPLTRFVDDMIAESSRNPFRIGVAGGVEETLTPQLYAAHIDRFTSDTSLRPLYANGSLEWLLNVLSQENRFGVLRNIALREEDGSLAGWYMYQARNGGRGEVLQICATQRTIHGVFDHLVHDAWEQGCIEITGRVDPKFMKQFGERHCLFSPGKNWMLVNSYRPELLNAIFRGDASLSRLEGDLWFF